MTKQKFGLGRGLDALISGASEVMAQQARTEAEASYLIAIENIIPNPRQPRRIYSDDDPKLRDLSDSIKEHGLIQPIVVARLENPPEEQKIAEAGNARLPGDMSWFSDEDKPPSAAVVAQPLLYQIIAGERRWRAARMAGVAKVPVVIKEVTPQQMLEMALIENIQRADLNPIEEALAYQSLVQEFGLTQEAVAKRVGKDRSTITNSLRLLQLAPRVREALIKQSEHFSEGHARALIGISDENDQITAMGKIITQRLSVRQAEELAAHIKATQDQGALKPRIATPRRSPELEDIERQFRESLMVKVDLKQNAQGRGTLVLHFNNQEELARLYSQLIKHEH